MKLSRFTAMRVLSLVLLIGVGSSSVGAAYAVSDPTSNTGVTETETETPRQDGEQGLEQSPEQSPEQGPETEVPAEAAGDQADAAAVDPADGLEADTPSLVEEPDPFVYPGKQPSVAAARGAAGAATDPLISGFQAGNIISDENFYASGSMSVAQVQQFLNAQMPNCLIGPVYTPGQPAYINGNYVGEVAQNCLNRATFTTASQAANAYCAAYAGAPNESTASIIVKVGKACGVSPKTLLVRLQLEQRLVTDDWPTVQQFNKAMGYNCPDSGPGGTANCNPQQSGFFKQVYGSAWQVQDYRAQNWKYNYGPFRSNTILWNPNAACGTSQVYIENWATAILYIYTPYRPNQAALDAGNGTGDACSTYGNRNFYRMYTSWFGQPNTRYADVPKSYQFYKHIEWMAKKGYAASGPEAPYFKPLDGTTRGAMATFLRRMVEPNYQPKANLKLPYSDVPKSSPHYRGIAWMYERGYAASAPQFNPGNLTTRGAMATFLYRIKKGAQDGVTSPPPYRDVPAGSVHAKSIAWMAKKGYAASGPSAPDYLPGNSVSRGSMSAFLYRIYR